jgi:hypothetical protein
MCKEGFAAVEDLPCFFVHFSAYYEDLRIYWGITKESGDGERRHNEELAVYLVADLAGEI